MAMARPDEVSPDAPREDSLEALFAAWESPLLDYAQHLLNDAAAAEAIVQDAFTRLHARFEHVREPRRWLFRTVRDLAQHQQSGGSNPGPRIAPHDPPEASGQNPTSSASLSDEQIARWEGIGLVRLSLRNLDERSRELIRLKFNDELSCPEIGARTGLPAGEVTGLLHQALKTLVAELVQTGIIP